jgi:hypothetical protein
MVKCDDVTEPSRILYANGRLPAAFPRQRAGLIALSIRLFRISGRLPS